jgi:hypothetical protein
MASKKAAAVTNGHVSLAREEYAAFTATVEDHQILLAEHEKTKHINRTLTDTLDLQAKSLSARDMKITHLERTVALQKELLDLVRDKTKVASLENLTEFWRQWQLSVHKNVDDKKTSHEEAQRFEPNLFKSWRNWLNNSNKQLAEAGTFNGNWTGREMQEHTIVRLRQENAALVTRLASLEAEVAVFANQPVVVKP